MASLVITVTAEDAPTLDTERRDEILSAFIGAARKLGLDGIQVSVDAPPTPYRPSGTFNRTEWAYEQASWDKRHGRV